MPPIPPVLSQAVRPSARSRGWTRVWMVVALVGLGILWRFEPAGQPFYPRCALYEATGWKCPTCGATRAIHALLHGDWSSAWRHNALVVLGVPAGLWWTVREAVGRHSGKWWPLPRLATKFWTAIGFLVGLFGIVRNLHWP